MKIALVAMVAALAAIGFTAPAYAGDNDNSGVQLTLAASFPFAPELLAQAVAAARTQADIEASAVEKLKSGVKWTDLPLEERIAADRRVIRRGKKMTWWGLAVGISVGTVLYSIAGEDCYDGGECTSGQRKAFIGGTIAAAGGASLAGLGIVGWMFGTRDLHRAEAEREKLDITVAPTSVAANYRFSW